MRQQGGSSRFSSNSFLDRVPAYAPPTNPSSSSSSATVSAKETAMMRDVYRKSAGTKAGKEKASEWDSSKPNTEKDAKDLEKYIADLEEGTDEVTETTQHWLPRSGTLFSVYGAERQQNQRTNSGMVRAHGARSQSGSGSAGRTLDEPPPAYSE
jgi:hypothetical protein